MEQNQLPTFVCLFDTRWLIPVWQFSEHRSVLRLVWDCIVVSVLSPRGRRFSAPTQGCLTHSHNQTLPCVHVHRATRDKSLNNPPDLRRAREDYVHRLVLRRYRHGWLRGQPRENLGLHDRLTPDPRRHQCGRQAVGYCLPPLWTHQTDLNVAVVGFFQHPYHVFLCLSFPNFVCAQLQLDYSSSGCCQNFSCHAFLLASSKYEWSQGLKLDISYYISVVQKSWCGVEELWCICVWACDTEYLVVVDYMILNPNTFSIQYTRRESSVYGVGSVINLWSGMCRERIFRNCKVDGEKDLSCVFITFFCGKGLRTWMGNLILFDNNMVWWWLTVTVRQLVPSQPLSGID